MLVSLCFREFRFTSEVPIRLDYHGKHVAMEQVCCQMDIRVNDCEVTLLLRSDLIHTETLDGVYFCPFPEIVHPGHFCPWIHPR